MGGDEGVITVAMVHAESLAGRLVSQCVGIGCPESAQGPWLAVAVRCQVWPDMGWTWAMGSRSLRCEKRGTSYDQLRKGSGSRTNQGEFDI
jgi:hypothetical protein